MKPEGGSGKWEVGDSSQRALVALYFGSSSGLRRRDFRPRSVISGAGRQAGDNGSGSGAMPGIIGTAEAVTT